MASNSCCLCLGSIPHCHSCPRPSAHQPPDVQKRQKQQRSWQFCPRGGKPATPIACKTRHHLRPPSRKTFKPAPSPRRRGPPGKCEIIYVRTGRKRNRDESSTAITRPRKSDESWAAKTTPMVFSAQPADSAQGRPSPRESSTI
jgi:hypothetical protein